MLRDWWRTLARRRSPSSRPRKRSACPRLPLYLEPLEERILLSGQSPLPPAIVVGRTLSSYFVGGLQNNQETITYTVYNEQANPVTGVLLTDTLEPGVTVASATPLPDQSGANLAWSLGPIQGFDRASITLTVNLATPTPLRLDAGAQAFATLDAAAVSNTTPAVVLRLGNVSDPRLLASTPDANTTDPFIQEQAAKLNYDPQQIFAYLHNDVGYNSYTGSVRGARGTLWSAAGNALDVASLGVALMRASGIPAQYVSGTLSQGQAQQLILSMFPASLQTAGYIAPGTPTVDPADDPQLLSETESHHWFQFNAGGGMQDADPLIAGAQVGQAFTAATGMFTEVPDKLRATTEVKLTAEIYSQAGAAFGLNPFQDSVVLDQSFNDVDLVGKPLTIGHFVSRSGIGALLFSVTNTYSPYLRVGDDALPGPSQDQIIRGTDYQEVLTNFPLGSQILTGLFLDITTADPQANGQAKSNTTQKTLFDRLGYAARQVASASSISADPSGPPALSPLDVTTLLIAASAPTAAALTAEQGAIGAASTRLAADAAQAPAGSSTAGRPPGQVASDITQALGQLTAFIGDDFLALSAAASDLAASTLLVKTYFDSPQIIAVSGTIGVDKTSAQPGMQLETDILRDAPRGLAAPGQSLRTARGFQSLHGASDSALEGQVLQEVGAPAGFTATSSFDVFSAAAAAGTPIVLISKDNLTSLSSLPLSDEAKARITAAVEKGLVVLTPTAMTAVNGGLTSAWVEINPVTASEIYVSEDGTHGALTEKGSVLVFIVPAAVLAGEVEPQLAADLGAADAAIATSVDVIGADAQAAINELNALLDRQLSANLNVNNPSIEAYEQGFLQEIEAEIARLQQLLQFRAMQPPVYVRPPEPPIFVRPPAPWVGPVPGSPLPAPPTPPPGPPPFTPIPPPNPSPLFQPGPGTGSGSGNPDLPAPEDPHYISDVPPALLPDSERRIDEGPGQPKGDPPVSLSGGPTSAVTALGALDASWQSLGATALLVQSLNANGASVLDESGKPVGSGAVALASGLAIPASISGDVQFGVTGTGILSFYGPSGANLGVSARWGNYTATVAGTLSVTLTTGGLTLNGAALPAGTYTISANAATLSGSGNAPSPNFSSTVAIRVTGGTVGLGPSSGNLVVGGNPLDATSGATLTGYTGNVTVTGNDGVTDNVTLDGGADNVLTVSASAAAPATDQNTPVTFHVNVNTTFTDGYAVSAHAPPGWGVSIDSAGNVTATPAPGLQGGTYPIQVIAQSTANPDLVARTTVNVAITPTASGLAFSIIPDPQFTLPFDGAQLPTAFRAVVHNSGPTADTYNLSFSKAPSGFALLNSGTSVTVPAGQTGIVGIYLQPNTGQPIPAPGTQLSFTVTATSTSNPAITQTQTEDSTVPAIDAVTLSSNTTSLNTTPGTAVTATITLANVGNVPENITLAASDSSGLTASSLNPVSLAVGQSTTETVTLTPDASTPLNSSLQATITATFGPSSAPVTQTLTLPVNVVVPGAAAIANASVAAGQLGDTNLADRLNDLSTALTNLVQDPTSAVDQSQVQASLTAIEGLLEADAYLASLVPTLKTDGTAIAQAGTASQVQAAATQLGNDLTTLSNVLADEAAHGFTLALSPDTAPAQVGSPTVFAVALTNTGSQATTYDLSASGLSANVAAQFMQNGRPVSSVAIQPGQTIFGGSDGVTLQLTEAGSSAFPASFTVTAVAEGSPEIALSVHGNLTTGVSGNLALTTAGINAGFDLSLFATHFPTAFGIGPLGIAFPTPSSGNTHPVLVSNFPGGVQLFPDDVDGQDSATTPTAQNYGFLDALGLAQLGNAIYMTGKNGLVIQIKPDGSFDQNIVNLGGQLNDIVPDPTNGHLFVAFQDGGIDDVDPLAKVFTPFISLPNSDGLVLSPDGNILYVESSGHILGFNTSTNQQVFDSGFISGADGTALGAGKLAGFLFVNTNYGEVWQVDLSNPNNKTLIARGGSRGDFVKVDPYDGSLLLTQTDSIYRLHAPSGASFGSSGPADPEARGVVLALTPTQASAGQGTSAVFTVQVTNTGSADDTFTLTAAGLPAGVTATFGQDTVEVPPGASNFRDVTLTLTPPAGTAAGSDPFTVTATSVSKPSVTGTAAGTLKVLSGGVHVTLSPSSGPPGTTFQVKVTNTGQAADTYDVALGGPGALAANFDPQVTLAPGASQTFQVATGPVNFAVPGPLPLMALATSQTDPAVRGQDSATLAIPGTTGLTASFSPGAQTLSAPGPARFLLLVQNTGNTEDSYTATITGSSGPVSASLVGLDGLPAQAVPVFRLPGLSTGAILLNTNLAAFGQGAVTVQIHSLTDGALVATATATVTATLAAAAPAPAAPAAAPALVVAPSVVAEGTAPVLTVLGARFTPGSVVRLHVRIGRKTLVLRLRTVFLGPGMLQARLPVALGGSRFVLDEGQGAAVSVFTPGVGETVAVPLTVREAAVPGRIADPREEAVLEFLERRTHREVTLDDFAPPARQAALVDRVFRTFHLATGTD